MRVRFVRHEHMPEAVAAQAELVLEEGPLAGCKLVGFTLRRSPEGEVYVTFPARAFGAGSDRRYFEYLRPDDGRRYEDTTRRLKTWILEQYATQCAMERVTGSA